MKRSRKRMLQLKDLLQKDAPYICPKCKGMRKNPFSFDNEKLFDPKWKTLEKGRKWQCRNCGYIKEIK
jgi:rubrerythrin